MRRMTESMRRGAYRIGYGWGQENLDAFMAFSYRDLTLHSHLQDPAWGAEDGWDRQRLDSVLRALEAGDLLQCGFYDGRHDRPTRVQHGDSL